MAPVLTLRQINRSTLARQMLLARERVAPAAAIERLIALQAQWPRPPFVGLWSRIEAFDREALLTLFMQKKVVRATFLRATIHVVTANDYVALRPVIQPALEAAMQTILRERIAGIDLAALVRRARAILEKQPMTFDRLRDEFLRADPAADERALGYAVRLLLPLVQVPAAEAAWGFPSKACFAPADRWLGHPVSTTAVAPDQLILRYLRAYGPATAADIQAWSGIARPIVRDALVRLKPTLRVARDEGRRELFDIADAPYPDEETPAPVRFVPEYDNLITARADERVVARRHRPRVFLPGLRIAATVLVDGFAAATWKLEASRKSSTIVIEPFAAPTPRVRREVAAEGEALARFAAADGRSVDVKITPATN